MMRYWQIQYKSQINLDQKPPNKLSEALYYLYYLKWWTSMPVAKLEVIAKTMVYSNLKELEKDEEYWKNDKSHKRKV